MLNLPARLTGGQFALLLMYEEGGRWWLERAGGTGATLPKACHGGRAEQEATFVALRLRCPLEGEPPAERLLEEDEVSLDALAAVADGMPLRPGIGVLGGSLGSWWSSPPPWSCLNGCLA